MDNKKLRKKLIAQRAALETEANAILGNETREYGPDDQKKVDGICAQVDAINQRLDAMDAMTESSQRDDAGDEEEEGEDEEGEDEENKPARSNPAVEHPAVVRSRGRRSAPADINEHAKREGYSIARAATSFVERGRLTGVEAETDQELRRNGGGCSGNFKAPLGDVRKLNRRNLSRRDLTLTTGAGAIPVYTDAQEFIDYLYPKMVGPQLGFRYIEGLMGVTKFPRQSSVPTVTAVAESGAASGSAPGIDYVQFTPHTITANVTISRKFAMQSVVAADRYVMESGSRQVGVQLDQWAISGDGASNRPTGLTANSGGTQLQIATANAVVFGDLLAMKKQVAKANANFGNLGWLTSPAGFAKLSQTPKIGSTFPVFLIDDNGNITGIQAIESSQVGDNLAYAGGAPGTNAGSGLTTLIYGNWEMLAVALFGGGLDVVVDPYTQSKAGDLIITFLLDADTNLLQPSAFSICPNVGE